MIEDEDEEDDRDDPDSEYWGFEWDADRNSEEFPAILGGEYEVVEAG